VRSGRDPALWAANATGGTGVFARQQAERDAAGRVLLILGGLAALTGGLLGAPVALAAARRRRAGGGGAGGGQWGRLRDDGPDS
jgi:hypothetical protein